MGNNLNILTLNNLLNVLKNSKKLKCILKIVTKIKFSFFKFEIN